MVKDPTPTHPLGVICPKEETNLGCEENLQMTYQHSIVITTMPVESTENLV